MADHSLDARSAFSVLKPVQTAAFSVAVRDDLNIVSIAQAKGKAAAVRAAIREAYGLELPETPLRVEGSGVAAIWHGDGQWLMIAARGAGDRDFEAELKERLAGIAAVTDQSDGLAVVRVSGTRVRDVLAKSIPIDLHPPAFASNGVAISHASHIGIVLWQIDTAPSFEIAVFRSYADSFARGLMHAAAEFTVS